MSAEPLRLYDSARASEASRNTGILGGVATAIFGLYLCLAPPFLLGPKVEASLFPVFAEQSIPVSSVTRIDRSLCWDWVRTKARAPELLDLDVNLDTADGDSFAPEIYNPDTGQPWHKGGALPAGHYDTRFCTTIPASVSHDKPVRLRQTLSYRGFLGLWTLRVPLPSIVAN